MNISDVRLITKPQTKIGDEYSSRPTFEMPHNKQLQDIIAKKHIYGHMRIFDLAINYSTSIKKIKEYIANYNSIEHHYSNEQKNVVINLSKMCSNSEISARTGVDVGAVSAILKRNGYES